MAFSWSGMDISIQTLTGAIFELRVSPFESLVSIKSKLERLEGIPISQQHLIWQSVELADDACLHDYGVKSGATLTLVLAMRDGPVNMRRVSTENTMDGVELLMNENSKEDMLEQLMMSEDKKHITFLVFCEGDQLNFFRVCERNEGEACSPYAPSALANANNEGDDEIVDEEKQKENFITKDKMKLLRQQIEAKCTRKETRFIQASRPPSTALPSANLATRILSSRDVPSECSTVMQCSTTPNAEGSSNTFLNIQITPSPAKAQFDSPDLQLSNMVAKTPHPPSDKTSLPPISGNARDNTDSNACAENANSSDKESTNTSPSGKSNIKNKSVSVSGGNSSKHASRSSKNKTDKKDKKQKEKNKSTGMKKASVNPSESPNRLNVSPAHSAAGQKERNHCTLPELNTMVSSHLSKNNRPEQIDDILDNVHLPNIDGDAVDKENRTNLLNWVQSKRNDLLEEQPGSNFTAYGKGVDSISYYHERSISRLRSAASHVTKGNMKCLPAIHNENGTKLPAITGKKKLRCSSCAKKLGLTTTYKCRCEGTYCAKHRYPETHTCTFDYKTEGRRILERNNPVVTAPKLPKI